MEEKGLMSYKGSSIFVAINLALIFFAWPKQTWAVSIPLVCAIIGLGYVMTKWTPKEVLEYIKNQSELKQNLAKGTLVVYFLTVLVSSVLFS